MTRKKLIKTAVKLNKRHGWIVLPKKPSKKHPAIKWKELQDQKATPESTKELFGAAPLFDGICLITGRNSGAYVVDCDNKAALRVCKKYLPKPDYVAKTKRGFHLYYKAPLAPLTNQTNILGGNKEAGEPVIDIRAENGIAAIYLDENDYKFKVKTPYPAKQIEKMIRKEGKPNSTVNASKKDQLVDHTTLVKLDGLEGCLGKLGIDYETQARAKLRSEIDSYNRFKGLSSSNQKEPTLDGILEHLKKDDKELIRALTYITPDCEYDDWRNIGACLKYRFGDNGYSIFEYWSDQSEKHGSGNVTDTFWCSLKGGGVGYIFTLAKQKGYTPGK